MGLCGMSLKARFTNHVLKKVDCFVEWRKVTPFHCRFFTDGVNPNKLMPSQKSMWPIILTWINLPFELRQLFGPMFWVGIIPGVLKGNEPKSLEPYLELVTNEVIQSTEFPVISSYAAAPVTVKTVLLQFLCDIFCIFKSFFLFF